MDGLHLRSLIPPNNQEVLLIGVPPYIFNLSLKWNTYSVALRYLIV